MDWFERITGFKESSYDETRERLSIVDGRLHSSGSSRTWGVGVLETPSLAARVPGSGVSPSVRGKARRVEPVGRNP